MQKVAYLFFCKDNANRRQYKINSFIFIVEVPLILFKDNANRVQYKMKGQNTFIFIAEVPLILSKDNAFPSVRILSKPSGEYDFIDNEIFRIYLFFIPMFRLFQR